MRDKEEGAGILLCSSRASPMTLLHLIKVPPSPSSIMLAFKLLIPRPSRTLESRMTSVSILRRCVVLIFVYILFTWKVSREVEFLSNVEHSGLRSPYLSPSRYPPLYWGCQLAMSCTWFSAGTPLVGRD